MRHKGNVELSSEGGGVRIDDRRGFIEVLAVGQMRREQMEG